MAVPGSRTATALWVRRTPREVRLACCSARVVGDELHLCSRAPTARTPVVAVAGDPPAGFAPPLLRERLDENAAIHVESDDLDGRAGPQFSQSVRRRCSCGVHGRARGDQRGADAVLVERGRDRVDPVGDAPDAALEISRLAGKQAEEDLRGPAFDPHDRPPREKTGACSSTSRSDSIGLPVGNRSLTHSALVAGSLRARKNSRTYSVRSRRRFSSSGPAKSSIATRASSSLGSSTGRRREGSSHRGGLVSCRQAGRDRRRLVDPVQASLVETGERQLEHAPTLGGDRNGIDEAIRVGDERRERPVHGGVALAADLVQHDDEARMACVRRGTSSG